MNSYKQGLSNIFRWFLIIPTIVLAYIIIIYIPDIFVFLMSFTSQGLFSDVEDYSFPALLFVNVALGSIPILIGNYLAPNYKKFVSLLIFVIVCIFTIGDLYLLFIEARQDEGVLMVLNFFSISWPQLLRIFIATGTVYELGYFSKNKVNK